MRYLLAVLVVSLVALPAGAADLGGDSSLYGDYLEARTAEVFVGECLANSETGLVGREAVLAWRVSEGEWGGVDLEGLSVVAVVTAGETLGDVRSEPVTGRSVIVVDEAADAVQREALVRLVHEMAGGLVREVVSVRSAAIAVERDSDHGLTAVEVADVAAVEVRPRHHEDGLCGNEDLYYPPLVDLDHAHAAFTLRHEYGGSDLGSKWRSPGKSSAFVGSFSR